MNRAELLKLMELLAAAQAEKHYGARSGLIRLASQRVADAITAIDTAAVEEARRAAGLEVADG